MHLNPYKLEYMCEKQLQLAILACRLPIKPILIKHMFAVLVFIFIIVYNTNFMIIIKIKILQINQKC